jgi:hypothetical protein
MNSKHFTPCMLLLVVLATGPSARHAAAITNEKTTTREPVPKGSPAQGSVDLAGFAVRKGDAREPVMRRLSKLYELQKLRSADGEEDAWLISEKKQTNNYIGVVSFASGRVRRVARFRKWTQDDDSVELAQRLCDLLENLTAERGNSATLRLGLPIAVQSRSVAWNSCSETSEFPSTSSAETIPTVNRKRSIWAK